MLTRLKVTGFKNLVDTEVRFGPFTCIAGPNGVGKSNLFDAIRFLSATANRTLVEAALSVRSQKATTADVRDLFHRCGDHVADTMSFEVEMIAPAEAVDDLGQQATATANLLRYTLELRLRSNEELAASRGPLEILKEELVHIHLKQAGKHLRFDHTPSTWRKTALCVKRRAAKFISTEEEKQGRVIRLHEDGGGRGRGTTNPATQPRTVLSVANAAESPTALCAKREMESWQLLQFEPSSMREPDSVSAPTHLATTGSHLASTLFRLARVSGEGAGSDAVYCRVVNRLKELINDVAAITVDRDEKRELLTLKVTARDGAVYPARSLSDGTLRFLALAVLEMDSQAQGVVCLEEPENGIHPDRIPAMIRLLRDIATDPDEPVDETNPLRQVIINTHSPGVVLEVPEDSLVVVETRQEQRAGCQVSKAVFGHLPGTWRMKTDPSSRAVPLGKLLAYLNPVSAQDVRPASSYVAGELPSRPLQSRQRRVVDREDLQAYFPGWRRVAE